MITVLHQHHIHTFETALEAKQHLSAYPATIRVDLHGVLDVIPVDTPLVTTNKIVCISFVGPNTYNVACKEICDRICAGQIEYGVLVFKRGKGKNKFTFVEEVSKAWVNKHIPCNNRKCVFIDDSTDHLRSIQYLLPDMECILFNTGIPKQLLTILNTCEQKR